VTFFLVQLTVLELRQHVLGERLRLALDPKSLRERQRVAHFQGSQEHLQLSVSRAIPKEQSTGPVTGVEVPFSGVAQVGQKPDRPALRARWSNEVDVLQWRSRQARPISHTKLERHAACDPENLPTRACLCHNAA